MTGEKGSAGSLPARCHSTWQSHGGNAAWEQPRCTLGPDSAPGDLRGNAWFSFQVDMGGGRPPQTGPRAGAAGVPLAPGPQLCSETLERSLDSAGCGMRGQGSEVLPGDLS